MVRLPGSPRQQRHVRVHALDQAFGAREAHLVADPLGQLQPHLPAIEVAVEIEQVCLDLSAGALKCRGGADADGGAITMRRRALIRRLRLGAAVGQVLLKSFLLSAAFAMPVGLFGSN